MHSAQFFGLPFELDGSFISEPQDLGLPLQTDGPQDRAMAQALNFADEPDVVYGGIVFQNGFLEQAGVPILRSVVRHNGETMMRLEWALE